MCQSSRAAYWIRIWPCSSSRDVGSGPGGGRGDGRVVDRELEGTRQVGVEVAHDANDLVDLGLRRALDVAHHGGALEAQHPVQGVRGLGGVVDEVVAEVRGADAVG